MSLPGEAGAPADPLLAECCSALGPGPGLTTAFVPGRVELFGKHTDYAGGSSIVLATRQGFRFAARPRSDDHLRIIPAADTSDERTFTPGERPGLPPGDWLNYAATTARRLVLNFSDQAEMRGIDIAFASDLPIAAGMSSSSALMVGMFLILSRLWRLADTPAWQAELATTENLVEYLGCVENGQSFGILSGESGVGTFGGSEDHAAMMLCRPDRLALCSFAPTRLREEIAWPREWACVIASSGVAAEKTGARLADYNRAALRARRAIELWNAVHASELRHLGDLVRDRGIEECEEIAAFLAEREQATGDAETPDLAGRFRQFAREELLHLPAARSALLTADSGALGRAADLSHADAGEGLGTLIPETAALHDCGRALGAPAVSYFGAGFGGSVWAVLPAGDADAFAREWLKAYTHKFPERARQARTLLTRPGAAARVEGEGT